MKRALGRSGVLIEVIPIVCLHVFPQVLHKFPEAIQPHHISVEAAADREQAFQYFS